MMPIREVLRLLADGVSGRAIAKRCHISRHTVQNYAFRAELAGVHWPIPEHLDDFALEELLFPAAAKDAVARHPQPNWENIHIEMKRDKCATLKVLHEEYLRQHPDGMMYVRFCQLYKKYVKKLKPYLRMNYRAGEYAFVDFVGPTVTIHAFDNGAKEEAQIFIGVLGASGYIYAEAVRSQKIPDWLAAHTRMYEFFGGVPEIVVPDNLKSAVIRPDRYVPDLNASYEEHARHYGVSIIPARPHKPKDKAKAERSVQIVERAILFRIRKIMFTCLADLNAEIEKFLYDVNSANMKRFGRSRAELFEVLDRPALRLLPVTPYEYAEIQLVRVDAGYHFSFDQHAYSVPYQLINEQVKVRAAANTVEAYFRGKRVAIHVRSHVVGGETTDPTHRDPRHNAYLQWDREEALRQASLVGPACLKFLELIRIQEKHIEHEKRNAQSFQRLVKEFGAERVEAACSRAVSSDSIRVQHVRNLLTNNRESVPPLTNSEVGAVVEHDNLRSSEQFAKYMKAGGF